MAVTLVHNCPHCGVEKAGFTFTGESSLPDDGSMFHVFFRCNACFGPVVAIAVTGVNIQRPSQNHGDIANHGSFGLVGIFPKPEPSSAPEHTPPTITRAFIQAEDAIKKNHWESASAMDRRALELATKEMAPDHAGLSLYQRIEKLAEAGKLTPSLKDWAHDLRIVGNEALHEAEGPGSDQAIQTHELTRFVLTYLYTLPVQVAKAREAREKTD